MRVYIKVEYGDREWIGKEVEQDQDEEHNMLCAFKKFSKGQVDGFNMETADGQHVFFGNDIIKSLIITVVKV